MIRDLLGEVAQTGDLLDGVPPDELASYVPRRRLEHRAVFEEDTRQSEVVQIPVGQQPDERIPLDVDPVELNAVLCRNPRVSAAPGVVAVPIRY